MESWTRLTIRFPAGMLAQARALLADQESFNDFVVRAVEREIRQRQRLAAHGGISHIREHVKARTGLHTDSTPYIRELRDERADRG